MNYQASSNSTEMLGPVIVTYGPPLRRTLALRFITRALPAAGVWYLMVELETSLLIPLLALVAIPLSFHSFSLLLRSLHPGERIAIHEHGIVIDSDNISWESIDTIHYMLDLGPDVGALETNTHKFQFVLKNQSLKSLDLERSSVESHVNIEEFLDYLRSAPPMFEADHEAKLRSEPSSAVPRFRNAEKAAQLQAGLDAEITLAQQSGISKKVVSAFHLGQRLRRKLARRTSRSATGLELLVLLLGFVLAVITLLGLISALIVVFVIIQGLLNLAGLDVAIIDTSDFPIAPPTFVIPAVIMFVCFLLADKLAPATEALKAKAQKLAGVHQALRERAPEQTVATLLLAIEHSTPYALYLRSFAAEHFQYEESTPIGSSDYVINTQRQAVERVLDGRLMAVAGEVLPVFALANANDPSPAHELNVLFVPDENWRLAIVELICHARVVIVHLAAVTESLVLELELLDRQARHSKTLLLRSADFSTERLSPDERSTLARFENQLNVDEDDWESGLARFLTTAAHDKEESFNARQGSASDANRQ
jgi:hypothetical protein